MKTFLIKTGLFVAVLTLTSSGKMLDNGNDKKTKKEVKKVMKRFLNKYQDTDNTYYAIAKDEHTDFSEAQAYAILNAKMSIAARATSQINTASKVESNSGSSNKSGNRSVESVRTSETDVAIMNADIIESEFIISDNGNTIFIVVMALDKNYLEDKDSSKHVSGKSE